ncbi:MAG: hypothetical protein AAGH70_13625 [Pseudomonadota bacterium]
MDRKRLAEQKTKASRAKRDLLHELRSSNVEASVGLGLNEQRTGWILKVFAPRVADVGALPSEFHGYPVDWMVVGAANPLGDGEGN